MGPKTMTDHELRDFWRKAGGNFHGPYIETGTMPESQLLPFLRSLVAAERERYAQAACEAGEDVKRHDDLQIGHGRSFQCQDLADDHGRNAAEKPDQAHA